MAVRGFVRIHRKRPNFRQQSSRPTLASEAVNGRLGNQSLATRTSQNQQRSARQWRSDDSGHQRYSSWTPLLILLIYWQRSIYVIAFLS